MPTERRLRLENLLFDGPVRQASIRPVLERHDRWSGSVVLDHGCGDAWLRAPLQARGATYIGLDPFSKSADLVAPGEAIPLPDASVDVVISQGVLHVVPHPWKDMAEIARVLRPGGRLLAFVAFTECYHESSTFHISHRGIETLCRDSGLVLEEIAAGSTGLDYQAAEAFFPMGKLPLARRLVRSSTRAVARLSLSTWAAAFAAVGCARARDWRGWPAARLKWNWYFRLALASGFEFTATKPEVEQRGQAPLPLR